EKLRILIEDREIDVQVLRGVPEVLADAELTSLILRQLINNALKYSNPESPIEIRACVEDDFVRISVNNQGPGIPLKERARVFDRYYRMPQHADRVPGTGLGLHIAKNIVEAHGGAIRIDGE